MASTTAFFLLGNGVVFSALSHFWRKIACGKARLNAFSIPISNFFGFTYCFINKNDV